MTNLRIVSSNAADRGTTTASSAVGSLAAINVRTDKKGEVHRSAHRAMRYTTAFSSPEILSMAALLGNFSPTARMRVRLSNESTAVTNLLIGPASAVAVTGRCEAWGNAPASVRYVTAPDGTPTAVVPKTNESTDRWDFAIPANTYPNGTQITVSWHQKTVPHTGLGGQSISVQGLVGVTAGAVNTSSAVIPNGFVRKWVTFTVTATAAIQQLRFYLPTVGADDIAAWGWQMELGAVMTSYYPNNFTFIGRASIGTYIDVNGLVATAASGVARMQYHYPSLAAVAPQMLIEPAATNLATYSQDFTNAIWGKAGAGSASAPVVTANYAISPDGTLTADRIVFARTGNTANDYSLITRASTGPDTGPYTASLWMKSNTGQNQLVVLYGALSGRDVLVVTPQWQRFEVTATSANTTWNVLFGTRGGSGFYYTGGDTNIDISVWQGQIEAGSVATSDIYTTTAAVTRAADNYSVSPGTRPAGYIDWWQSYAYDSGEVLCCPAEPVVLDGWTAAQSASAYSFGGGAAARVWMTPTTAVAMAVDITDTNNLQGYVEAWRLIAGQYWEPATNADYGAEVTQVDLSKNSRNGAGDLITDNDTRHRRLSFSLSQLAPADRNQAWKLLRRNGVGVPAFVSLRAACGDVEEEAMHELWGKLVTTPSMKLPFFNLSSATLEFEGT